MAPKDFVTLIKHYYKVSVTVALVVIGLVVFRQATGPSWLGLVALGVLASWAIWAALFIHRVNQERRRQ